jgi:hypothetical protein
MSDAGEHTGAERGKLADSLDCAETVDFNESVLNAVITDEEVGAGGRVGARSHFESEFFDFLAFFIVDVELL